MEAYYQQTTDQVLKKPSATADGLSEAEVASRHEKYGLNALEVGKQRFKWSILFAQFKDV